MAEILTGKVAVVTGASSGIGAATAMALANAGAAVMLAARRAARLNDLAEEISAQGGEAAPIACDVTRNSECRALIEAARQRWGRIDVLVNNAGVMPLGFVRNVDLEQWERMVDVNLKGVLFCTAAVVPHMIAQGSGHIVNVSSIAGKRVFPGGSVYCATKFAVSAFSEGLRQELGARENIRVTTIHPGIVETELADAITDRSLDSLREYIRRIDALQPEDIADCIVFAVGAPAHVNVNDITVRPIQQER